MTNPPDEDVRRLCQQVREALLESNEAMNRAAILLEEVERKGVLWAQASVIRLHIALHDVGAANQQATKAIEMMKVLVMPKGMEDSG